MRPDGKRVKNASAIVQAIPYIMPKRYDAQNFITEYAGMKNICGAYFMEEYRGSGIPQGLLSFLCDTLKKEGVTHLGVDCETMNPTALRFWEKNFEVYTYSFARRIDERVKRG